MGLLERIGGLLDVEVTRAESEGVSGDSASAIASLAGAAHRALMARALEERLAVPEGFGGRGAEEDGGLDRAAELLEVEGREFRLAVSVEEDGQRRTVEQVVRASDRDAALEVARAAWPGADDVVVVDEGGAE